MGEGVQPEPLQGSKTAAGVSAASRPCDDTATDRCGESDGDGSTGLLPAACPHRHQKRKLRIRLQPGAQALNTPLASVGEKGREG